MRLLIATFWIFLLYQGGTPSAQSQLSSPAELIEKAGEMFSGELAQQVQEQILHDMQQEAIDQASGRQPQSLATLFLADRFYRNLNVGRFNGAPTVTWNGYDSTNGIPAFLYEKSAFSYVTSTGREIVPGTMDTDGGSIPKVLHSVGDYTPWGYGPAYIIHDWIFVAHKCRKPPDDDISFEMSALLLAESLKTLMERGFVNVDGHVQKFPKKEDTLYLIYQAVRSGIARKLWNATDAVSCR